MRILASLLCDAAADYRGKLCVMGAFDTLRVRKFPAILPHCAIALRVVFAPGDEGEHHFKISLIDPDGNRILPEKGEPEFKFTLPALPLDRFGVSQNFVMNLQGLPLARAAAYSFDVRHNDAVVARIPFNVEQA